MNSSTKILALDDLRQRLEEHRSRDERIVLANGCFDLLHVGHVRYLEGARREGDVLVVALNSDESERAIKGNGRPFLSSRARAELVAALRPVSYVVVFDEPNVEGLLSQLRPDVHAKGTDYTVDTVPEREVAARLGVRVAIVGDAKQHSTRELIARVRAPYVGPPYVRISVVSRLALLVVKLGSLGDLVFTLPAVAALREAYPNAQIDWIVESRWAPLLDGNPDINELIPLDRGLRGTFASVQRVRRGYSCVIDFQGLYKSAVLSALTGASQRIGFDSRFTREPGASFFYTKTVTPRGAHMVDQNLALAEALGARNSSYRFRLPMRPEVENRVAAELARQNAGEFFVVSPGGGWRSKLWPPERYGILLRELAARYAWRGVVSFGPGEEDLAQAVCRAATELCRGEACSRLGTTNVPGEARPVMLGLDLAGLIALLRRAKFVVAADSGPLHLAVALGTPVVGLYGPTRPARNGPFSANDVVVRNARPGETTLRRDNHYSRAMLSITVEQVVEAVARRMELSR